MAKHGCFNIPTPSYSAVIWHTHSIQYKYWGLPLVVTMSSAKLLWWLTGCSSASSRLCVGSWRSKQSCCTTIVEMRNIVHPFSARSLVFTGTRSLLAPCDVCPLCFKHVSSAIGAGTSFTITTHIYPTGILRTNDHVSASKF